MAGGPYTDTNGSKYIIWSDKRLHPNQPKKREELKTKKTAVANTRKYRLEELYEKGKHNPWKHRWYDNPSIKPFVTDSLLSGDVNDISTIEKSITLLQASERYIQHKLAHPRGWRSEHSQNVYPANIRYFIERLGPRRHPNAVTEDDINKALYRKGAASDQTLRSDRSKLNAFFTYCHKQEWMDAAPEIETPEPQKKVPKFFYDLEFLKCCWYKILLVQSQIEEFSNDPQKANIVEKHQLRYVLAWQVMAGTGMRPGEAFSIHINDVHNGQILVGSHIRGKTNEQRMVPLLYEARSAVSVLRSPSYRKHDYALRNSTLLLGIQSARSQQRVSDELREAWAAIANRGKRTSYNLRDYFAVRYLADKQGASQDFRLLQLRNILGHQSISTTEKYLKAVPSRLDLTIPPDTDFLRIFSDISSKVTKTLRSDDISD